MILDTNALSAWRDSDAGARRLIDAASTLELPVIVLGEYRYGILRSRKAHENERWLNRIIREIAPNILPVVKSTADHYATIRRQLEVIGRPIPGNDLWIAALALEHKLPVLSRDAHFDAVDGLQRITW